MAKIAPATTTEFKALPADIYEATVVAADLVENNFYDPAEHSEIEKMQVQIDLKVRDGEFAGTPLRRWMSQKLSSHEKANTAKFVAAITGREIAEILKDGFDTDELVGKGVRVVTEQTKSTKLKDDGTPYINNKVTSLMPSKMPSLSDAELQKLQADAALAALGGEEIPF